MPCDKISSSEFSELMIFISISAARYSNIGDIFKEDACVEFVDEDDDDIDDDEEEESVLQRFLLGRLVSSS